MGVDREDWEGEREGGGGGKMEWLVLARRRHKGVFRRWGECKAWLAKSAGSKRMVPCARTHSKLLLLLL